MLNTNYTLPNGPLRTAIEEWEADTGQRVLITAYQTLSAMRRSYNYEPHVDYDVAVMIGNFPDAEGNSYTYQSFYEITGLPNWSDSVMYDVRYPYAAQITDEFEQLEWGAEYDGPGGRATLPFWFQQHGQDVPVLRYAPSAPAFETYGADLIVGFLDQIAAPSDPEAREQARLQRQLDVLATYYREGASADLRNLRDEIGDELRQLAAWESSANRARQALRDKQARLDLLIEQSNARDAAAEAEAAFAAMQNHPQIERAMIMGQTLTVETIGLDIEHPLTGQVAYLGKFRVELNIGTGSVSLRNLDNMRNGHDHPHVSMGSPCFGEMDNTILELTRAGQLLGAVEMIFVFLSSCNPRDDWGRTISYWMEQLPRPVDAEVVA